MVKTIISGGNPNGKSVLILGGIHGDELTPVYTLATMVKNKSFKLDKVKDVVILNGINITGLRAKKRDYISNNTSDLNRISDHEVPLSEVMREVKNMIHKSDVVIDVHSSPTCTEFALIDIDEYTMSMKKWCDLSGLKTAFRYSGAGTLKRYCLENNKASITLELNKLNSVDYVSVVNATNIINNLIDNCADLKIELETPDVNELVEVKTYEEGIIVPMLKNGDIVFKNDLLYNIISLRGELISSVRSKITGTIICEPMYHYAKRGDTIFIVQP